jgi:hypothetical protein
MPAIKPDRTKGNTMASSKTQTKLAASSKKTSPVIQHIKQAMAEDLDAVSAATDKKLAKIEKAPKQPKPEKVRALLDVDGILAQAKKLDLKVEVSGSQHKVLGAVKGERLAVAKNGRLADLIAFTIKHDAVEQFTPEQAKAKHIGKVRGRYLPTSPKTDAEVIQTALRLLARQA